MKKGSKKISKKWRWVWKTPLIIIGAFVGLSFFVVIFFRFVPPILTPLMIMQWAEGHRNHKPVSISVRWRSLNKISPYLAQAVIASEDQRFFQHNGFDWEQIDKAIEENKHRKSPRGASTISMQTARNVFLWQGKNWFRKGLEAYFTVLIEKVWSKKRILEVYLNVIEWGPGIYGAEAASRAYFYCSAKQLIPEESALMAAVLPNPHRWCPARPSPYILMRQEEILRQMDLIGPIDKSKFVIAY